MFIIFRLFATPPSMSDIFGKFVNLKESDFLAYEA